jgi:ABC-type uncharacterized transport system involved in gliding motility auxiliary subunit
MSGSFVRTIPVLLGLAGFALALVLGALNGHFLTWHFAMAGLGVGSIGFGLLWLQEVRWRESLTSLVYTIFVLLSAVMLYLISANRPQRFDLTRDSLHTLSPQTKAVLGRIPADRVVRLELFTEQRNHPALEKFLENYQRIAPQLSVELFDPKRDLDAVASYGPAINEGQFFLAVYDGAGELLRRGDGALPTLPDTREHIITNALARLLQEKQEVVYWSTGLGEKRLDGSETSLTKVASAVSAQAVKISELRLMEGRIPADATAIVICGPRRDLSDYDLELLQNYLAEGGKLFLLLDPTFEEKVPLPNFDKLVGTLGLEMPDAFVIDPLALATTRLTHTPQTVWIRHPIGDATNKIPFMLDRARPILAGNEVKGTTLTGIFLSNESCWFEPVGELKSFRRPNPPEDASRMGNQLLAVTAERQTPGGRFGNKMRAVLLGDSDAFIDRVVETNGDAGTFFVQSVNWLRERQDLLQIPPRAVTATPVTLTPRTAWTLLGLFALMGIAVCGGGTAWALIRRRIK